jgi:hypothetical protein
MEIHPTNKCGNEKCAYPAVLRNRTRGRNSKLQCCVHNQSWFPRAGRDRGSRGHLLVGLQYLRHDDSSHATCVCTNETCKSIGYSGHMVKIPHDKEIRGMIVHALLKGLPKANLAREKVESEIMKADSTVFIAPWHFHPDHCELDVSKGEWRLKPVDPTTVFSDSDNKKWIGFPPPNYVPKTFYDLEIEDRRGRPQDRSLAPRIFG